MNYKTNIGDLIIRTAHPNDSELILSFIKKLASYEHLLDKVSATKAKIKKSIFINKEAEVLIAVYKKKAIGFALFNKTYSTFLGQSNMHLEDIYVDEDMRNLGIGKEIFKVLAKIALTRKYQRFEWNCLSWNKPSLLFYKKLGSQTLDDWIIHRLGPIEMKKLVAKK